MMVNVTIDEKTLSVAEGTLVVDAAKQAGITIPVFCYHPKLKPAGMCRMCLVEIGTPAVERASGQPILDESGRPKIAWNPKLQTACTTPVSEGMQVHTATPAVREAQRGVLEFLLTSHPLDCPICDKGGECPLQNLTLAYGPGQTRFEFLDKQLLDKHVPLGERIWLDRERCIQCGRCIRFQSEIAGEPVLGFSERGRRLEVITFSDPPFNSIFSGNTTDLCPVGALTTRDFRFRARPWELTSIPSLCDHCAVGCNTTLDIRRSAKQGGEWDILRVMPRQNEAVNEIWLCDKGRFGHTHARSPQRLTQPLVRWGEQFKPVSWDEALAIASAKLKAAGDKIAGLVGGRIPNEDAYVLARLFCEGFKSADLRAYPPVSGAQVAQQYGVAAGANWAAMDAANSVALIAAADLKEEAPLWYLRLRQRARLLHISSAPCPGADLHLACQEGTESIVALGLLNVMMTKGWLDPATVARLDGMETLRSAVLECPPAQVSALSGVPAESITAAARALVEADHALFIFSGLGAPESLAQHMANLAVLSGHVGRPNSGLLPVWPQANTQGVLDQLAHFRERARAGGIEPRPADFGPAVMYLVGADPLSRGDSLPEGAFVICHELFLTDTARKSDLILPAVSWAERDGTYTNAERRVQRFYKALPALAQAQPDWDILGNIARKLGLDYGGSFLWM